MMHRIILLTGTLILSSYTISPSKGLIDKPVFSKSYSFHIPSEKPSFERSSIGLPSSREQSSEEYFSCPKYGPFHVGDPDFDATFTYRIFGPSRSIIERIRIFSPSGSVIYAATKAAKDYTEDDLNSVTFKMPIKDYLTKEGMAFKFEIYDRTYRKVIREYGTTIYPIGEGTPSYQELKRNIYETKPIGFYGDGEIKPITEKFDFTYLSDYLDIDYYYRLNIQPIDIKYDSAFSFSYSSMNLRFEDRENLFPYFRHDGYNVNIPLKGSVIAKKIHLNYKNSFYVNRTTLQLADSIHTGFLSTNNFYLPINGKRIFNNKLLYLDINKMGKSELTVSFPIRYVADRLLVGLCGESDYYVEGGMK